MLLLVHKAHQTLLDHKHPNVGRLVSPRHYGRIEDTGQVFRWAADNDAYSAWDQKRYLGMLEAIAGVPGCLFVTAPDVVADAGYTERLYEEWEPVLTNYGLPLGYVAQDGATSAPWDEIAALFVGGSTEWKLGEQARELVLEAKDRGKWVHMGRVNTWRRLEYAKSIGVDSVDGTRVSKFTDDYLPRFSEMAAAPIQGRL